MKLLKSTFLSLLGILVVDVASAQENLVKNPTFTPDAQGVFTGWEVLGSTTEMTDVPPHFGAGSAQLLCTHDAGGVQQTLSGLKGDQAYRLRVRAFRQGPTWSPVPFLTLGGIPLELTRVPLPNQAQAGEIQSDDTYTFDQIVRPGEGSFPLRVEVKAFIPGFRKLGKVWLAEASLVPVDADVPLLAAPFEITPFWDRALPRAGREERVGLQLSTPALVPPNATVRLIAPDGIKVLGETEQKAPPWQRRDIYAPDIAAYGVPRRVLEKQPSTTLFWNVRAEKPGDYTLTFEVAPAGEDPVTTTLVGTVGGENPPAQTTGEIPKPVPADTGKIKVGVNFYPGWVPGTGWGWSLLDPYPHRKPALGYYDDSNPEVMDWQIKYALEHGVSFFNFCLYRERGNEGSPAKFWLNETLDKSFLKAKFLDQFEFAITWENTNAAGVSSEKDLLENLLPAFIEYFKHPSYVTFQKKPILFIYSADSFVTQLGGVDLARSAMDAMRESCRKAGLPGLIILGEFRGNEISVFKYFESLGFDGTWSYGMENVEGVKIRSRAGQSTDIQSISVGWDPRPWQDYINYWWTQNWYHTPEEFQNVAEQTKQAIESFPEDTIARHFVLLDNWNEWGEGHYIAPARHHGFGYLEAIRRTFAPDSAKPVNLLPEDVGMGPYDAPYRKWIEEQKTLLDRVPEPAQVLPSGRDTPAP